MTSVLTKGQKIQGSSLQKGCDLKGAHCWVSLGFGSLSKKTVKGKRQTIQLKANGKRTKRVKSLFLHECFHLCVKVVLFLIIRAQLFASCTTKSSNGKKDNALMDTNTSTVSVHSTQEAYGSVKFLCVLVCLCSNPEGKHCHLVLIHDKSAGFPTHDRLLLRSWTIQGCRANMFLLCCICGRPPGIVPPCPSYSKQVRVVVKCTQAA